MARILLAWELGGGFGHCVKLSAIGEALIARGHELFFAARHLVTARRSCGNSQMRYLPAPYLTTQVQNPVFPTLSLTHILHNSGFDDRTHLEGLTSAWQELFATIQPAAIVCDHAPMALLASRGRNLKRFVVGTGFSVPMLASPFPDFRYWRPSEHTSGALEEQESVLLRRINDVQQVRNLPPLSAVADLYREVDESFLMTFPELDHYPQRVGARYYGVYTTDMGCRPTWPAGDSHIFAYLRPSSRWKLESLLGFIRDRGVAALIYAPGLDTKLIQQFQTNQLVFLSEPAALRYVIRHCDVAISHGSSGALSTFLLAGVPQLNIPLHPEQAIAARRVTDLGAGLAADPTSSEQINTRLSALLQGDRYRVAARDFGRRYKDFDPARSIQLIVDRIDRVLR